MPKTANTISAPIRAKPATHKPITEPPLNATFKVLPVSRVSFAAFVTRTFAYVAIFIPTKPAAAETSAPIINAIPVCQLTKAISRAATTEPMIATILYSYLMKAFAPTRIAAAISCILSVPSFNFFVVK